MSNSLVLIYASIHSGALDSSSFYSPSTTSLYLRGKSGVFICSLSSLDTKYIFFTKLFTLGWILFHWKKFLWKLMFSMSIQWFIILSWLCADTKLQVEVDTLSNLSFPLFWISSGFSFLKKYLISFVASRKCASLWMNSKSLMKFSLISYQLNVCPHASSILYHLCGISSIVFGNIGGHILSSWYTTLLHSFSHWWMWSIGLNPCLKVGMSTCVNKFLLSNISKMYKVEVFHVCSCGAWVFHHQVAWSVKDSTQIFTLPCPLTDLDTSTTWSIGEFLSLNHRGGFFMY